MATRRRVFIDKIKKGSKFRTLLGAATGGAVQGAKYIYPNFQTFTITVSIDPNFAKFLPLSPEWQAIQKAALGPGTAAPQDYIDSTERLADSLQEPKFTEFMTFMFDNTIFDDDFYQDFAPYGAFIESPVK